MNEFERGCLTTKKFLKSLKNVKTILAMDYLRLFGGDVGEILRPCVEHDGVTERKVYKISPYGAKKLLVMYQAGMLPMSSAHPKPYTGDYPGDASFAKFDEIESREKD